MKVVVTAETWPVSTRGIGNVNVAVKHRASGDDLLVFLHGLGCAKESFDGAFEAEVLARYSLLTFDFPEHGESQHMRVPADIPGVAEVVGSLLSGLSPRRVHLVCHSMGGAIGLVAAQELTNLATFISVEGNLVAEDCGLVSRGIAEQTADQFAQEGFSTFVNLLESSMERSHARWAQWYKRCNPYGLHSLAGSLVQWCDNDKLIGILSSIGSGTYIHGQSSDVDHLAERLGAVPRHAIAGSGHFPMLDNPGDFYTLIGAILNDSPAARSGVVSASLSV